MPSCSTSDAPMCWVMPPRSPAATSVERSASSRLVLPWSTWPITVTIGARGCRRRGVVVEEHLLGRLGGGAFGLAVGTGAVGRRGDRLGHLVAELGCDERRGVAVDELVDGREDAALDQLADDVRDVDREEVGELLDGDGGRQLDRATFARIECLDLRCRAAVATRRLAGAASAAGAAPTPGHGLLLRCQSCVGLPCRRSRGTRAGAGSRAPDEGRPC